MHRCTSLLILLLWPLAATAVDFADYDYDRFSQTVTLCDRLAAHGRDPGHVAPAGVSATIDKPAAIEVVTTPAAATLTIRDSIISWDGPLGILGRARVRCLIV